MESSNDSQPKASNESVNSKSVGGLAGNPAASESSLCSGSSETVFGFLGNQKPNAKPLGLSVHNAAYEGGVSHLSIHLSNMEFDKSQKPNKKRPQAAKPKCRTKSKPVSQFKADQRGLAQMNNPYFNFLRAFRVRHSDEPKGTFIVQKAALFWNDLNGKQRALFKPENLNRGVSAVSILNHLQYWKSQQQNNFATLRNDIDVDDDNEDSCCHKKKRKSCAKKRKPSCPRRKKRSCRPKRRSCRPKKRSCRPKRRSCRPKKRSCRPKRRSCRPKKKACRPKPKCRPKRRC